MGIGAFSVAMRTLIHLFIVLICNRFKSRHRLEIENLYLRHQLNIAMRRTAHRLRLRRSDRMLLVWMTWLWPDLLSVSRVVGRRRSCAGTEQGFEHTGAGSLVVSQDAPRLVASCVNSFGR